MGYKILNFVTFDYLTVCTSAKRAFFSVLLTLICICVLGCSDQVRTPSTSELAEFEKAGPRYADLDIALYSRARGTGGAYRIMPGEVVELTIPAILEVVTADGVSGATGTVTHACRANERGTITLPVVGEIEIAGRTLTEIEKTVIDAYYPKYSAVRPSVLVRLTERLEQPPFTVLGLVNDPGTYPYPPDLQYNLMQAIAFAKGLDFNLEPRYATVYRLKGDGSIVNATFHIAQNSKFVEASITNVKPGDVIVIEHTPRTRTKAFLNRVFRVTVGAYVNARDLWEE